MLKEKEDILFKELQKKSLNIGTEIKGLVMERKNLYKKYNETNILKNKEFLLIQLEQISKKESQLLKEEQQIDKKIKFLADNPYLKIKD